MGNLTIPIFLHFFMIQLNYNKKTFKGYPMKTAFLSIITFLLILTGCGSSKNNPTTTPQNTKNISKIVIDRIGNDLVAYPNGEIISTQELFETTISDLKETANTINSNASKDKKQVNSWIKALKDTNIDFKKDNILIYTFREDSICNYKEDRILKDTKQINITFTQTNEICMDSSIIYFLAYKVSKDVKKVSIKAFEKEAVEIDM